MSRFWIGFSIGWILMACLNSELGAELGYKAGKWTKEVLTKEE